MDGDTAGKGYYQFDRRLYNLYQSCVVVQPDEILVETYASPGGLLRNECRYRAVISLTSTCATKHPIEG